MIAFSVTSLYWSNIIYTVQGRRLEKMNFLKKNLFFPKSKGRAVYFSGFWSKFCLL